MNNNKKNTKRDNLVKRSKKNLSNCEKNSKNGYICNLLTFSTIKGKTVIT